MWHNMAESQFWLSSRMQMFALFTKLYVTELSDPGYIEYGAGDFDGQNSGHDFYGVSWSSSVLISPELTCLLFFRLSGCRRPASSTTAMVAARTPTAITGVYFSYVEMRY